MVSARQPRTVNSSITARNGFVIGRGYETMLFYSETEALDAVERSFEMAADGKRCGMGKRGGNNDIAHFQHHIVAYRMYGRIDIECGKRT